jgi:hypothetical protein
LLVGSVARFFLRDTRSVLLSLFTEDAMKSPLFVASSFVASLFVVRLLVVGSLIVAATAAVVAQESPELVRRERTKNAIYLEFAGSGGYVSINYDRIMPRNWGFRAGLGYTNGTSVVPTEATTSQFLREQKPGSVLASSQYSAGFTVPVTASYFLGGEESRFELGFGVTTFIQQSSRLSQYWIRTNPSTAAPAVELVEYRSQGVLLNPVLNFIAGYRYQPVDSGLLFRVAFTPMVGYGLPFARNEGVSGYKFYLWGGASVGYTF